MILKNLALHCLSINVKWWSLRLCNTGAQIVLFYM